MEPLSKIRIAKPCPASWDEMSGTDTVRHCSLCDCKVYNLSGMGRDEANRLILETEGRICARYYKRADGFVLTQDCPLEDDSAAAPSIQFVGRLGGAPYLDHPEESHCEDLEDREN